MCGTDKDCGCNATQRANHQGQWNLYRDVSNEVARYDDIKLPEVGLVAAGEADAEGLPATWHAVLTVEGLRTTDHRRIAENSLTWRQLPLAIFAQFNNAGHFDAPIVGSITSIERVAWNNGTYLIQAEGTFDLANEPGRQAAQMCADQVLRWGSVDLEVMSSRYVEVSTSGAGSNDLLDVLFGDEEVVADDWYDEVTEGRVMGYTMIATPAFPQAVIAPSEMSLDIPDPMGEAPMAAQGLMASAVKIPATPPASHFENPNLTEATPLEITDDGRIFGHLALWNTCHTGFSDSCVMAPKSQSDYAYFKTGAIETADGSKVKVGHITYDTGHASATMGWQDTTSHYDHTGHVAADVTVGEDEYGIWISGALRSGLTDDDLRAVRSAPLSGDWRKIGGGLELVAALSVNVPGFPIVASAGMRNREQVSLITAGIKPRDPMMEMAREIATLRRAIQPLMGVATEQLSKRINLSTRIEQIEPSIEAKEAVAALVKRVNPVSV